MTIPEMEDEIKQLASQIEPLARRRNDLGRLLQEAKSREFIRVNGITKDQVQLSSHNGVWHAHIVAFGKWMAEQPKRKMWCEWNAQLHYTSKVIEGWFDPTPAYVEHVPDKQS